MPVKPRTRTWVLVALLVVAALGAVSSAGAAPGPSPMPAGPADRQAAFASAAREFGVPASVLLAVSYNVSRWDDHGGAPSTSGGYGPMHLTQVSAAHLRDGKGDEQARPDRLAADPRLHTLDAAAVLLGLSADTLKHDAAQNIRGGAALLAQYARETTAGAPAAEADWYGAVAKYSGSLDAAVALDFADTVFATIRQGAARTTTDGQGVSLAAKNIAPNKSTAAPLQLRNNKRTGGADCPNGLACEFIPAAYQMNNPPDVTDYGNYDLANRPADGLDIRYIVIHDTEVDYAGTLAIFQNPLAYVSSHYVVRSSDGHIAQMVENKNVAWHAGNWYINGHSIGLEHEGFAIDGAAWYSEQMYHASAKLVRYLAGKYNIPLDRAHIIGHDDIPYPTQAQYLMHWDPGPYWDWAHYMTLVGAPINPSRGDGRGDVVTIRPNFATNLQTVTDCEGDDSEITQPSNFVYLRTAPSPDAPYVTNPYLSDAPTCANNWANKAVTGQEFYRFAREGDWDGIYFGGGEAWFYNPRNNTNTVPGGGTLVTPKAGLASIPVYGRAYPEASAYPPGTVYQTVQPIGLYSIPAGQKYVAFGPFKSDYYWAPTYSPTLEGSDHVVVEGQTEYYQIFFNHRFAFVQASDVEEVAQP
jgi:N-acetyl-anhydromuramyl-L-alanine amidase AmpD